jgi:hypothetical protein
MHPTDSVDSRLEALEKRLLRMEKALGLAATEPQAPRADPKPFASAPVAKPPVAATEPRASSAGNWLGIVGAICFILAGVFLVRLAIHSGWLTPARQFAGALILGLTLILAGFKSGLENSKYPTLLPGAGIVVLFAAAIGGCRYFELYDANLALLGVGLVGALCLGLYTRFRSDFFIVTAAVGTYCLSLFLDMDRRPLFEVGAYFVTWSTTFSLAAVYMRTRLLPLLAGYLGVGLLAWCTQGESRDHAAIAALQALQFVLLSAGVVYYSVRNRVAMSAQEAWAYFPLLLFFYGVEHALLARVVPDLAPWIGLGFAGVLWLLHAFARKRLEGLQSQHMLVGASAVLLFHAGYLEILPESWKPIAFLAVLAGLAFARTRPLSAPNVIALLVLAVFLMIEYGRILWGSLTREGLALYGPLAVAALLAQHFVGARLSVAAGTLLLSSAHLQALASLYQIFYRTGSFAVSVGWALYAGAILAAAFYKRDRLLARSSVFVLMFSAGKALLYDTSNADAGVRVVCLLLTGALLYGAGYLFQKIARWSEK